MRRIFVSFYKELAERVDTAEEGTKEKMIEDYFRELYSTKEKEIDAFITESKLIIEEKSEQCLRELADLMDYHPSKEEVFDRVLDIAIHVCLQRTSKDLVTMLVIWLVSHFTHGRIKSVTGGYHAKNCVT